MLQHIRHVSLIVVKRSRQVAAPSQHVQNEGAHQPQHRWAHSQPSEGAEARVARRQRRRRWRGVRVRGLAAGGSLCERREALQGVLMLFARQVGVDGRVAPLQARAEGIHFGSVAGGGGLTRCHGVDGCLDRVGWGRLVVEREKRGSQLRVLARPQQQQVGQLGLHGLGFELVAGRHRWVADELQHQPHSTGEHSATLPCVGTPRGG
jgi:hypothetical protein